jgi:hypothetical protein
VPVLAVVGEVLEGITVPDRLDVVSLVAEVGEERALADTTAAIKEVVAARLAAR